MTANGVDWAKPIEAVEKATGRVVPMVFMEKNDTYFDPPLYLTTTSPGGNSNIYWMVDGRDNCSNDAWFIRNTVTPTPAIDWTKPLELEDGTPVVMLSGPDSDGDYRLNREDGEKFTEAQTGSTYRHCYWKQNGDRMRDKQGLRVRNRAEPKPDLHTMTVTGIPVPQGFAEVMQHTIVGAEITGILIDAPYSMLITTPKGTFEFRLSEIK